MAAADQPRPAPGPDDIGPSGPGPGPDDDEVLEAELVEEPDASPEESEVLEGDVVEVDPVASALAQRDEYLDSLRRLQAEFENYKKRVVKQQADQVVRAATTLVDKLLPVLDALDLAVEHAGDPDSGDAKALVAASGLLQSTLAKEGLERIDPQGEAFDPTAHEAVGHLPPGEDEDAAGPGEPVVAQVMRAGYRFGGTVIRPAMVTVRG